MSDVLARVSSTADSCGSGANDTRLVETCNVIASVRSVGGRKGKAAVVLSRPTYQHPRCPAARNPGC
jgi:hypothetical protein